MWKILLPIFILFNKTDARKLEFIHDSYVHTYIQLFILNSKVQGCITDAGGLPADGVFVVASQ